MKLQLELHGFLLLSKERELSQGTVCWAPAPGQPLTHHPVMRKQPARATGLAGIDKCNNKVARPDMLVTDARRRSRS